jgi:hypothetical protein
MPLQFKARSSAGVRYIKPGGLLVKIVTTESLFAEVEVVATDSFPCSDLTSSDPKIVSRISLKSATATSTVFEFYALNAGNVTLKASTLRGAIDYYLDVTVESRRGSSKTILQLLGRTLAVVLKEKPVEIVNMTKLKVPDGRLPADIIADIKGYGYLDHLYVSCHSGSDPLRGDDIILKIGAGFTHADASHFSALLNNVGTIWFSACVVLLGGRAKFAKNVAKFANCWVVGAQFAVPAMGMTGINEIEAFTGGNCEVYPPGSPMRIPENAFFLNRDKRKFKIARIGATSIGR